MLNDAGIMLDGSDEIHAKGAVLSLDPANPQTIRYLDGKFLAPVEVIADENMEDFVVTEEFLTENPLMASEGGIKIGDTIRVPKIPEEEKPLEEETIGEEVVTPAEPVMTFAGKTVVRSGTRMIGELEVHEITLDDGSTLDVSDEEYDRMVENAK